MNNNRAVVLINLISRSCGNLSYRKRVIKNYDYIYITLLKFGIKCKFDNLTILLSPVLLYIKRPFPFQMFMVVVICED